MSDKKIQEYHACIRIASNIFFNALTCYTHMHLDVVDSTSAQPIPITIIFSIGATTLLIVSILDHHHISITTISFDPSARTTLFR